MTVMKPRPPIWMSVMITIWPKVVQPVKVSRTIRPVTQVALVAVNSASSGAAGAPLEAMGSISSPAPIRITRKKLSAIRRAGESLCSFIDAILSG